MVEEHLIYVWNDKTRDHEKMKVRVTVDTLAVAKALANKAFRNKSGIAREVGGAVLVNIEGK